MKKIAICSIIQRWDDNVPKNLDSILNQTYTNWEYYILASETSKPRIEDYVKNNKKVKVILFEVFENNFLDKFIEISKLGDYFFNIDGDDYLEHGCLEKLVNAIEETNSDIACCGVAMHDAKSGGISTGRSVQQPIVCSYSDYSNYFIKYFQFYRTIWGKLFKSSLFTYDIFSNFPDKDDIGGYAGDTISVLAILSQTRKFVIVEGVGYHYMIWEGNVSKKFLPNREKADPMLYQHLEKFLISCDENISPRNKEFLAVIHNNGIGDVLKVLATSDLAIDDKLDKLHYIITNEVSVKTIPHAHPQVLDVFRHTFAQFSSYYQGKKSKGSDVAQDILDKLKDVEDVLSFRKSTNSVSVEPIEIGDNIFSCAFKMLETGDVVKGMDIIVELFNKDTYDENLLNILDKKFIQPNQKSFEKTYNKNVKLLENYPCIFTKNFKTQDENSFTIYPVSDDFYYEYNKFSYKFEKIEVNSKKETKYFFEHLDNPLFVENEFNQFNLNFLVDNVRASEDVAYENHIYLYYDNIEKLSLLMYYCDFKPLLKDKKLVFLIGEKEKSMYPINFKEKFGIDYEAMEFQPVRTEEIKRIVLQNHLVTNSGCEFFIEALDGHPNLLNMGLLDPAFGAFNLNIYLDEYIKIVNQSILDSSVEKLEYIIDGFKINKFEPFIDKPDEFIKFFRIFEDICIKNNAKTHKDWICANYLAFTQYCDLENKARIVPTVHHAIHFAYSPTRGYHGKATYEYLSSLVFNDFKYFKSYSHIRDPIVAIRGYLKYEIVKSIEENMFDFSMLTYWFMDMNFKDHQLNFFKHEFENKVFIRFEDMKLNPKATIMAMAKWLNIPYDKNFEICSFMGKPLYHEMETDKILSGFSAYPLYPRDMYEKALSIKNIEILEKMLYPAYSSIGYKPMFFLGNIYSKLTKNDFDEMLKNKFLFEDMIYQNLNLNENTKLDNQDIKICKLIELYRNNFYKIGINFKNSIIDKYNTDQIKIYSVLKPVESECVNPIYENMLSLPELADIDVDFISKPKEGFQPKTYWITGLSGSGKTTISKALLTEIQKTTEKVIFLDGDDMREHIASDLGYELEDRKKCALRYAKLCKMLSKQGFTIICATISMFDEVRDWNRKNINNYVEVYVKVSEETLAKRNQKDMYSNNTPNLMGVDIKPEYPKNPHITLENDQGDIDKFIQKILNFKEN